MSNPSSASTPRDLTLFLCGDVMPGRGIDQILPYPSAPRLYEPYVVHAGDYVALAESRYGALPRSVDYDYIWGDALKRLELLAPDVRIINLETAVTTSDDYWPGKGINYRMHPGNVRCLTVAGIDGCGLANNHVLDWGYVGLDETLDALHAADIQTTGAGRTLHQARSPICCEVPGKGRVLMFAYGHRSSGIPASWAATETRAGVALLEDLSDGTVQEIAQQVQAFRRPQDIVIASLHWGGNWGYAVSVEQRTFAHWLIDEAGIDVVHGHSSHHPKGLEIYHDKPIIYGCGDLLNDYEGISGYATYRGELGLMYLPTFDPSSGKLVRFALAPTLIRRFRLNTPSVTDIQWMADMLNREGRLLGTSVHLGDRNIFEVNW